MSQSLLVIQAVTVVWLAGSTDATAQTRRYAGRPVAEVLQELQTPELRFIFSSDLVPPSLRVTLEPTAQDRRQIARQILEAHGLTLQQGPRNSWLVVTAAVNVPKVKSAPARIATPIDQPEQPTEEPLRIEERVDVVDRLRADGDRATTYTLTGPTIRETAGGLENAFQVLQLLPGVAATNDEDGKSAVRGAGPEHNLIVIDGIAIHSPQRFGDFTSSFLNPATAASVTLDASGLSARHGGRLSSITAIETRDGNRDRRLGVSGSLGLTTGDILLEGRLPNTQTGAWWATARGTYYRAVLNGFNDGTMPGFADVQFKISAQPTPKTRLSVFGLAGRESMTRYAFEPGGQDGQEDVSAEFKGISRLGVMNLSWTPTSRVIATTTISAYAHDSRDHDGLTYYAAPFYKRDVSVDDFAARQRAVVAVAARHVVDVGFEAHRVGSSWRMSGLKPPEFYRGLGPSTWGEGIDTSRSPVESRLRRTEAGAWVQDRMPLGANWVLEPGARVDWNSFTDETSWQPRVRLSGRFGNTVVWAGASLQTQTPSHESLQGFDYFHLIEASPPTLRNERSRQIVVGIERPLAASFGIRLEGYHRQFDRLLVQRLESDTERAARLAGYEIPADIPPDDVLLERRPTIHPESTGTGEASGLEVLLTRTGRRLGLSFGYTLSKSTRDLYGHTVPFDFDRRHAASATGSWQISDRIRFAGTWRRATGYPLTPLHDEVYFGRRINLDGSIEPIARPSRQSDGTLFMGFNPLMRRLSLRNAERLSPYSRTDVRVTYATGGHWEFYGEVINLFNERNYLLTIDVPPLANGVGGWTSRNNVYTELERIPTFGIRVTF